ncbi:type I methionyl aminopeptidase [Borrelia miyamotoi]|uniref:Methionine aminopeptidase n=1 Tax=Borrelia miyamotoi TaxID=47466 RepID=A0AAX3JNL5_9SPIR|nr:type I methionyl aminopeptidase [Borrelia miyamotoi]QFP42191.1 type I methionyl aminopeptidase [Borrelia miyamotoi]QFP48305.1 type I methionyl aminopeptidase [Borrelia miyamotoi]QGT56066.1 type I methionyl aminopeptidase [Borrelia miyamotoi]QGT56846.1 type I methionyl aminopeptidase [Borrelia miyamotoi]WAZ72111.1 type I methionyl aminopeptidase [Borrelia miyamotoi]
MKLRLKSREEIAKIRASAVLLAQTLLEIEKNIVPGVSTSMLDKIASNFITKNGGKAAFKAYNGFKGTICASVNEEVIHGIPGVRKLKEGDVVSIDCGVVLDGFYSDMAKTFKVGKVSSEVDKLLKVGEASLYKGISEVKVGNRILDISRAIENYIKPFGFGIVREYTGHGVGFALHEEPSIPNYYEPFFKNIRIQEGMVLAIEPMVNLKGHKVSLKNDGWTVFASDFSCSVHFEHTVAVVDGGPLILSKI